MVGRCASYYELILVMHVLHHLDALRKKDIGMHQSRLVANELSAPMCVLWIFLIHELFELLIAIEIDRVPELRPALMQVINAI